MLIVELNTSSESFQTDYKWFSISTLHFKKVSGLDGIQIQLCIHQVPTDWLSKSMPYIFSVCIVQYHIYTNVGIV